MTQIVKCFIKLLCKQRLVLILRAKARGAVRVTVTVSSHLMWAAAVTACEPVADKLDLTSECLIPAFGPAVTL